MENRTIKFRAWIPTGFDDDDNPTGFKMIDDLAFEEYLPINDHLRNFESPLMQFTGLLDKRGREIYESDILLDGKYSWEVYWYADHACFATRSKNVTSEIVNNQNMIVIGNIYENPDY